MRSKKTRRFLSLPLPQHELKLSGSLSGVAYRFAILIPVISRGREVFSENSLDALQEFFTDDFGGCTYTVNVTHPLIEGTWKDQKGCLIRDKHVQFVVYTTQTEHAVTYFIHLQQKLEKYGKQERIIIEQTTVRLL